MSFISVPPASLIHSFGLLAMSLNFGLCGRFLYWYLDLSSPHHACHSWCYLCFLQALVMPFAVLFVWLIETFTFNNVMLSLGDRSSLDEFPLHVTDLLFWVTDFLSMPWIEFLTSFICFFSSFEVIDDFCYFFYVIQHLKPFLYLGLDSWVMISREFHMVLFFMFLMFISFFKKITFWFYWGGS